MSVGIVQLSAEFVEYVAILASELDVVPEPAVDSALRPAVSDLAVTVVSAAVVPVATGFVVAVSSWWRSPWSP